jgi:outer membrane protein assembly factor BamB
MRRLVLAALVLSAASASAAAGDIPESVLDDLPLRPGKLVWRKTLPGVRGVYAAPLADGERLFVAACHLNAISDDKSYGVVFCLKSADGSVVWSTKDRISNKRKNLKPVSISSPFLADGKLYVGEGFHQDTHCSLYRLDAAKGTDDWQFQTQSHTESSPVVADGKVFFGAGDNGVFAVDARTGKEVWNHPGLHIDASPLVVGKRLYVGSGVGDVFRETAILCLDVGTGKAVWRRKVDLPAWGSPVLAGDLVYFGIGNGDFAQSDPKPAGALLCVRAADGVEVWRYPAGDGVLSRPALDRSCVYFGSRDGVLTCLDRRTGKLIWKRQLGSPLLGSPVLGRSGPIRLTTGVYVVASGGQVFCLGPKTGRMLWSADLCAIEKVQQIEVYGAPALTVTADGKGETRRLYVAAILSEATEAKVFCFEDRLEPDAAEPTESRP